MNESKILVVDDNPTNLKVIRDLIEDQGYDGLYAVNGRDALNIAQEKSPCLILLDVMMPGMDGYEVCEHLKENDTTKDIPVIFLTALEDNDCIIKAFDVGGADYVSKPFKNSELLA